MHCTYTVNRRSPLNHCKNTKLHGPKCKMTQFLLTFPPQLFKYPLPPSFIYFPNHLSVPLSSLKNSMFSSHFPHNPPLSSNLQITPMDSSTNRPSPRSLQGPRPTPLKVRKDSYKINKKPPTIPHNSNHPRQLPQPPPPRHPVIIYTVSPKIIHTNPSDFMTLVQKLTGPNPHSVDSPSVASLTTSALSPAARFATYEKETDKRSPSGNYVYNDVTYAEVVQGDNGTILDRQNTIPGILSPVPTSLQPISSSFFSPITSFDPGSLSFLNDLSPAFAAATGQGVGGGNGGGGNFLVSPSNLFSASALISPGSCWDFFNQFDL